MTRINVIPPEKLTRPPLPLAELVDLASPFKAHRGGTCLISGSPRQAWKSWRPLPLRRGEGQG